jgi:hypothetical protein
VTGLAIHRGLIQVGGRAFPRPNRLEVFGYNAPATTTILYPRLIIGTGSDAIPGITVSGVMPSPTRASRLRRIQLSCTQTPGSTVFSLQIYTYGVGTWSELSTITATPTGQAASLIEWTADHAIPAGAVVALGIDPTTAPGMVNGTLEFEYS